jgi:hypothetical protein
MTHILLAETRVQIVLHFLTTHAACFIKDLLR